MKRLYLKLKDWAMKGFKYGKVIGVIWVVSFVVMLPLMFCIGGYPLMMAYIMCKLTGMCPL